MLAFLRMHYFVYELSVVSRGRKFFRNVAALFALVAGKRERTERKRRFTVLMDLFEFGFAIERYFFAVLPYFFYRIISSLVFAPPIYLRVVRTHRYGKFLRSIQLQRESYFAARGVIGIADDFYFLPAIELRFRRAAQIKIRVQRVLAHYERIQRIQRRARRAYARATTVVAALGELP